MQPKLKATIRSYSVLRLSFPLRISRQDHTLIDVTCPNGYFCNSEQLEVQTVHGFPMLASSVLGSFRKAPWEKMCDVYGFLNVSLQGEV